MGKLQTKEGFERKSNIIHHDKYNYNKVVYTNNKTKVEIICKLHNNSFNMRPDAHLSGQGCPLCKKDTLSNLKTLPKEEFLKRAIDKHSDRYDYSIIEYVNYESIKVKIICKYHGIFEIRPKNHANGQGCRRCYDISHSKRSMKTLSKFIEEVNIIHNNKYDYSKTIYTGKLNKITVICPIHGEFDTTPTLHLGQKCGCKKCTMSIGEERIFKFLSDRGIIQIQEKRFPDCINIQILPFDFYLPDCNICIEYDGKQHFGSVSFNNKSNNMTDYDLQVKKDNIKTQYCIDNNIKLIRIPYRDYNRINEILLEAIPKESYHKTEIITFISARRIVSYVEAKELLKTLHPEIRSLSMYKKWSKSILYDNRLPLSPFGTYKSRGEWISSSDFFNTKEVNYFSYDEAKKWIKDNCGIINRNKYEILFKEGKISQRITYNPDRTYKNEWLGNADFYGELVYRGHKQKSPN